MTVLFPTSLLALDVISLFNFCQFNQRLKMRIHWLNLYVADYYYGLKILSCIH